MKSPRTWFLCALVALACGCAKSEQGDKKDDTSKATKPEVKDGDEAESTKPSGLFRVTMTVPKYGPLRFYVELKPDGVGELINGSHRSPIQYVAEDDKLVLTFMKVSKSIFTLKASKGSKFTGAWTSNALVMREKSFPVELESVKKIDLSSLYSVEGSGSLTGFWRLALQRAGVAKATFTSTGPGAIEASFLNPTADWSRLAGSMGTEKFRIGTFDGLRAHIVAGTVDAKTGEIKGQAYFWDVAADEFQAQREKEDFAAYDPLGVVAPTKKVLKAEILESYSGRPLILKIGGTWCSSCKDLLPMFREIHEQMKEQVDLIGVEIEFVDVEQGTKNVEAYKAEHKIPWDMFAAASIEDLQETLPGMPQPSGFPTTVFVKPNGKIHAIHTGAAPTSAPKDYAEQKKLLLKLAQEITK